VILHCQVKAECQQQPTYYQFSSGQRLLKLVVNTGRELTL
jgi:hypothetical protein